MLKTLGSAGISVGGWAAKAAYQNPWKTGAGVAGSYYGHKKYKNRPYGEGEWHPGLPSDPRLDDNSRWPAIAGGTAGAAAFGTALYKSPGFRKAAWNTARVAGAAVAAPVAAPFVMNKWIGQGLDAGARAMEPSWAGPHTGPKAGLRAKRLRPSRIAGRAASKLGNKALAVAGRHPIVAGALVLGGLAAVSAGAKGIEHTANMAQQSSLIASYQNQQHQGLLNMAPGSRHQEGVAPTFSGSQGRRSVRGGHMGADGNLVFAMHNRR